MSDEVKCACGKTAPKAVPEDQIAKRVSGGRHDRLHCPTYYAYFQGADIRITELEAKVAEANSNLTNQVKDAADADDDIRKIASECGVDQKWLDGDSYSVPTVVEVVEKLRDTLRVKPTGDLLTVEERADRESLRVLETKRTETITLSSGGWKAFFRCMSALDRLAPVVDRMGKPTGDLLTAHQRKYVEAVRANNPKRLNRVLFEVVAILDSVAPKPPKPCPLPKCRLCRSEASIDPGPHEDCVSCSNEECRLRTCFTRDEWIKLCGDKREEKVTSVCSHDPTKPSSVSGLTDEKPRPCPFCGVELVHQEMMSCFPSEWKHPDNGTCVLCNFRTRQPALWNRRVAPPVTMRLAEAVKAYQYSNGENYPEKKHDMDMALAAFEAEFGGKKPT